MDNYSINDKELQLFRLASFLFVLAGSMNMFYPERIVIAKYIIAIASPLLFVSMGKMIKSISCSYTLKFLLKKFFFGLTLPFIVCILFSEFLLFLKEGEGLAQSSITTVIQYMVSMGTTQGAPSELRSFLWMFPTLFWTLIILLIPLSLSRIVRREINEFVFLFFGILLIVVGLIGIFLSKKQIYIPLGFSWALSAAFFLGVGILMGKMEDWIRKHILIWIIALLVAGWRAILPIANSDALLDIERLYFPFKTAGLIASIGACYLISELNTGILYINKRFFSQERSQNVLSITVLSAAGYCVCRLEKLWESPFPVVSVLLFLSLVYAFSFLSDALRIAFFPKKIHISEIPSWKKTLNSMLFFIVFSYCFFRRFLGTTMFLSIINPTVLEWSTRFYLWGLTLSIFIFSCSAKMIKNKYILLLATFLLCSSICYYIHPGGAQIVFASFALMLAATEKPVKKIAWIVFFICGITLITSAIASQTGMIEDLVYYNRGEDSTARHSLGIIYPTDMSAHVVYWIMSWCVVRPVGKKFYYFFDYLFIGALALLVFKITDSRTGLLCQFLVLLFTVFVQVIQNSNLNFETNRFLSISRLVVCFLVACVVPMLFLICNYYACIWNADTQLPLANIVGEIVNLEQLNVRFEIAHKMWDRFPPQFLGNYFVEIGLGGTTEKPTDFTFIDIAYVKMMVRYGLLASFMYLISIIFYNVRMIAQKKGLLLLFMLVVAVQAIFEHHLVEFHYNFLLLFTFASFEAKAENYTQNYVQSNVRSTS